MNEQITAEIPKTYDPHGTQAKWYRTGIEKGYFTADACSPKPPFTIVIPPPNVTDRLHMGHALNNCLQDILIRWKRMDGYEALWVPGTDHAGIATQNVVERELKRTEGKTRHDIGREALIKRTWVWKEKYGSAIIEQLKQMGCSCDWTRERFTLDAGLSRAVREVFVRLYNEGYLYRANYIVNWCPRCMTTLSDDEVEYEDRKGSLWHIRYLFKDRRNDSEGVVIATTRPETLLGDTAVAVHPEDDRYRGMAGRILILPALGREIPLIADDYVDREFGTGALKITPAHDVNDFAVGRRHNLPEVNVMTDEGRINNNGGPYEGMDRYDCRAKLVEDLKAQGLLVEVKEHLNRVGVCYRCSTDVEPRISLQWFVRMEDLMRKPIEAVRTDRTKFIPRRWEKTFFNWTENVRDWPISRQIWWGHQLPVWYCGDCQTPNVAVEAPDKCKQCGGANLTQDADVLDTWFSSALWPFSTLGWPDATDDLKKFYPTSTLVTDKGIIYFWVARMIMMGIKFMGDVPFSDVFINGTVCDEHGDKMSKSKGNGVDPVDVINEFGSDAMRFTLCALAAQGRNLNWSNDVVAGYRNFCNKIWNASRLVLMAAQQESSNTPPTSSHPDPEWPDRWILSRLGKAVDAVRKGLEDYRFNDAATAIYEFIWHEYCDWYLELIKPRLYGNNTEDRQKALGVALEVLDVTMRLMHPISPFISEEVWQLVQAEKDRLGTGNAARPSSIVIAEYPKSEAFAINEAIETEMAKFQKIAYTIRNIRGELNVSPGAETETHFKTANSAAKAFLEQYYGDLRTLVPVQDGLVAHGDVKDTPASSVGVVEDIEIVVLWPAEVKDQEINRLDKRIQTLEQGIAREEGKLSNESFVSRAKPEVVERTRESLARNKEEADRLKEKMAALKSG